MRHGKKVNHLGRTKSHRDALLSNLAVSLIKAKRIETTLAKAKSLRMYVEPLLTKAKNDNTHSRRVVFSYLQDKEAIKILFGEIAEKISERNGGYTRIIKLGQRQGDNAIVAMIELVDYNENFIVKSAEEGEAKAKRSRRGKGKKSEAESVTAPVASDDSETSAEFVEDVQAEAETPAETEVQPEANTEETPKEEKTEE